MTKLPDNYDDEQGFCIEGDSYPGSWREQISVEDEIDRRLHDLGVDAEALIGAPPMCVPNAIQGLLRELVRSLKGCRDCKHMLGGFHSGSCPSGGNYVLVVDLDERNEDLRKAPKPSSKPDEYPPF